MLIALLLATVNAVPAATPIDPQSWFKADDYPVEAMKNGIEGSAFFEVDVDATGKPGECRILVSSGSKILDQATCDAVRSRAQFKAALDGDGKPVAGRYGRNVAWRLPDKTAATYQAAILDFSADPAHPVCTIKTGPNPMGSPTCAQMLSLASQQGLGKKLIKAVYLLSVGSGDKPPYRGEADWGSRLSYLASEQYYLKGSYPIACVAVAAEGMAAAQDACRGFPGARTISEMDKGAARKTRVEVSIFAVLRSAASRATCDSGESSAESQGCN